MGQKFTVKDDSTLLPFLLEAFKGQSRTGVKAYLSNNRVLVNSAKVKSHDWPLRKGDVVEVISKDASIGEVMKEDAAKEVTSKGIRIVYEDEHLLVIDKRAGLPTIMPKNGTVKHTPNVYSILTDYMHRSKRAHIKTGEGTYSDSSRVFVVHRLDRDTSGLLLFAKDERTKDLLQSKWNEMVLERKYTAVVEGKLTSSSGTITSWLTENDKSLKMSSSPIDNGGLKAISHYKVTEVRNRFSVLEFELETGRKNQIRVHAASVLGHPIAGDEKYGSNVNFHGRIALHAGSLVFRNPYGGSILRFNSPIPEEFSRLR